MRRPSIEESLTSTKFGAVLERRKTSDPRVPGGHMAGIP